MRKPPARWAGGEKGGRKASGHAAAGNVFAGLVSRIAPYLDPDRAAAAIAGALFRLTGREGVC